MTLGRDIQNIAFDVTLGRAVKAAVAPRGGEYRCYCANEPHRIFVCRGRKRRPYFSHYPGVTVRSDPSRALHDWARDELHGLICGRLKGGRMELEWWCQEHCSWHRRDLLEGIAECVREVPTDKRAFTPDISLRGEANDIRTVIEVVHTNPPSDDKLVYYRMQWVMLAVIRATDETPLRDGVLRASFATFPCPVSSKE